MGECRRNNANVAGESGGRVKSTIETSGNLPKSILHIVEKLMKIQKKTTLPFKTEKTHHALSCCEDINVSKFDALELRRNRGYENFFV